VIKLRVEDLDYDLPPDRIATAPAEPRDSARLLVVSRSDPSRLEHRVVRDLPDLLRAGDALIVNTSKVLAARVVGARRDTGGAVDGLYLGPEGEGGAAGAAPDLAPPPWRFMLKAKRLREGVIVDLFDPATDRASGIALRLLRRSHETGEEGSWIVEAEGGPIPARGVLDRVGLPPLPPYIRSARKKGAGEPAAHETVPTDASRYQTVYARDERAGSVAAPTAGLHFTPELLDRLARIGVERGEVILHVGSGTFKPVECEFVEDHPMHAEWCEAPATTAGLLGRTRHGGGRVIAVGTTSARTLESFAGGSLPAGGAGHWTNLLITPGRRWTMLDGMLTNFHLPRSTLMAMVASLLDERSGPLGAGDGVSRLKAVYAEAIRVGYRFYSYGDAMLVLP
jgi:S-adenosylmethionine:tRNA ribosyltransferase-isomerase